MAIVKRNNEVIWDLNSKEMPGDVFEFGLHNVARGINNSNIASDINKKEMIGLGFKR